MRTMALLAQRLVSSAACRLHGKYLLDFPVVVVSNHVYAIHKAIVEHRLPTNPASVLEIQVRLMLFLRVLGAAALFLFFKSEHSAYFQVCLSRLQHLS